MLNLRDRRQTRHRALSRLSSPVFPCLPPPVYSLQSPASSFPSPVSHAVSLADLIDNDLAVLWSKLADFCNLAVINDLSGLSGLKEKNPDMKFSGLGFSVFPFS